MSIQFITQNLFNNSNKYAKFSVPLESDFIVLGSGFALLSGVRLYRVTTLKGGNSVQIMAKPDPEGLIPLPELVKYLDIFLDII
jgi:hypothetical protein